MKTAVATKTKTRTKEPTFIIKQHYPATADDLEKVKTELNAKIDNVKTELDAKIDNVKTELEAKIDKVDAKIDNVKTELRAGIQEVKSELTAKIDRVDTRLKVNMRWVIIVISLFGTSTTGLLVGMFFYLINKM